jgi:uncharacterized membrane protein YhiD involved in acid resistance
MVGLNINTILQIITTLIIAIIGFFLKRELKRLEDADKKNEDNIASLRSETDCKVEKVREENEKLHLEVMKSMNDFKESVAKEFVRRMDYIQTTGEINKKLDRIFDILLEMKGREK